MPDEKHKLAISNSKGDKNKSSDIINRFDTIDAPDWMIKPFKRNLDGFLIGRANITNVGVFTYRNIDGTETRELRLPEEVFSRSSLDSLKLKPITNDHPTEAVTTANVDKYGVGSVGSNPSTPTAWDDGEPSRWNNEGINDYPNGYLPDTDRFHLSCDMSITQEEAILDVLAGKMELSAGYTVTLEEASGTWMGMEYDAIQRDIRYNHVAIVDKARAGDAARIILRQDSADAVCIGKVEIPTQNYKEDSMASLRKTKIDGVEYEAEKEVLTKLDAETKRANASEGKIKVAEEKIKVAEEKIKETTDSLSKLQAEKDNADEKIKTLEEDLKKKEDTDPSIVDQAVKERMAVLDSAKLSNIEVKNDMSVNDIKKAVVLSVYGKDNEAETKVLSDKLDADPVYLNGRFDGAVDSLEKDNSVDNNNNRKLSDIPKGDTFKDESNKVQEKKDAKETQICNNWKRD